jgi:hypothetical protein
LDRGSLLDSELVGVGRDEGGDFGDESDESLPLAAVEGDREAAQAVNAETALLADLDRQLARGGGRLEGFVLRLEGRELCFEREGGHGRFLFCLAWHLSLTFFPNGSIVVQFQCNTVGM